MRDVCIVHYCNSIWNHTAYLHFVAGYHDTKWYLLLCDKPVFDCTVKACFQEVSLIKPNSQTAKNAHWMTLTETNTFSQFWIGPKGDTRFYIGRKSLQFGIGYVILKDQTGRQERNITSSRHSKVEAPWARWSCIHIYRISKEQISGNTN